MNLDENCQELGIDKYPWIKNVIKAASSDQDISRNNYIKEIQQIQFRFDGLVNGSVPE